MSDDLKPKLLALDFDGVLCNGMVEYFDSTCRAYQEIWGEPIDPALYDSFRLLRPVIETGWEMPVLLRALVNNFAIAELENNWSTAAHQIVQAENLDPKTLVAALDGVRDRAIAERLSDWLRLHQFYPGVLGKLQATLASDVEVFIVTTKEGRFVIQLLEEQGVNLPADRVLGKEVKRPKYETLRLLGQQTGIQPNSIWFVEDRLPALEFVAQQADLTNVQLFLASWGYNTAKTRAEASQNSVIAVLDLEQFCGDFKQW
ncbi:MAG: HAD hydrolase-like protein [Cyanobacteria bacterium P01_H01_bin.15]